MSRNLKNNFLNRQKITIAGIFCLFIISILPGRSQAPAKTSKPPEKIHIIHADTTKVQEEILPDIYAFYGNVSFRHENMNMYCDSAYFYHKTNSLEAFGNVRLEQGDSLFTYASYLDYDGNTQLAKLRENVRMENKDSVTLFTDNFDYDRKKNIGYFFDGGMIVDPENELTSIYGQYSPDTKIAFFRQKVQLKNPQFTLTSDTLEYNTASRIATISTPSVVQSDSGTIHSKRGWYNTATNESVLYDRSLIISKDSSKTITADSIFFNRETGVGHAYSDMVLTDSLKKTILTGNYGFFDNQKDYAFATDSARMMEFSKKDTTYIHADTLKAETTADKKREIRAYRGVRIFRVDLQGVCDSLLFLPSDSILHLYQNPVLWNTNRQMLADTIHVFFSDSTIREIRMIDHVFNSEHLDSTYYNQLKGRDMKAMFTLGELSQIEVSGNVEMIYYPLDKGAYVGLNKIIASFMRSKIVNRKPIRTTFWPEPQAKTYPIPQLTPDIKFLPDFKDLSDLRPKDPDDIFRKPVQEKPKAAPPSRKKSNSKTAK